jgi:hypothetical protein
MRTDQVSRGAAVVKPFAISEIAGGVDYRGALIAPAAWLP